MFHLQSWQNRDKPSFILVAVTYDIKEIKDLQEHYNKLIQRSTVLEASQLSGLLKLSSIDTLHHNPSFIAHLILYYLLDYHYQVQVARQL